MKRFSYISVYLFSIFLFLSTNVVYCQVIKTSNAGVSGWQISPNDASENNLFFDDFAYSGNNFSGLSYGVNENSNYSLNDYQIEILEISLEPPSNVTAEVFDINNVHLSWELPLLKPQKEKSLLGFNIYRNGILVAFINDNLLYEDLDLPSGDYEYCVSAVYDEGESELICVYVTIDTDCFDFDDLTAGGYVAEQLGGHWTTWSGNPGSDEDALVSSELSVSSPNSFIVNTNTVDLIYKFDDTAVESGQWVYSCDLFVPSGNSGYFNIQEDPVPGVGWVLEVFFDDGGSGHFTIDGTNTYFTYSQDTWFNVSIDFDFNTQLMVVLFDNINVQYMPLDSSIGGIDFYGSDSGGPPGAYYDDVCFGVGEPVNLPPGPTNLAGPSLVLPYGCVDLTWDAPPTGFWIEWDDGVNGDDGIGLTGGGTFYVASHWEPADLTNYDGMYLTKISFFPYTNAVGATFSLKVWSGADAGTLLLSQDVASYTAGEWNEITLDTPVMIDASQEFWFGYETTHPDGENPVGVDIGPAVQYKGDMLSFDASAWVSMSAEYGLDYNWNLAGFVSMEADGKSVATPLAKPAVSYPQGNVEVVSGLAGVNTKFTPSQSKDVAYYNVYRDDAVIGTTTETNYSDCDYPGLGVYIYYVTAVYDNGLESMPSNSITVDVFYPTGVDEYLAGAINVYPNPASDKINIKSDVQIKSVKVYNYVGQVIVNEDVNGMMYHFNTSQYRPGIYFFRIETEAGVVLKKVVIE